MTTRGARPGHDLQAGPAAPRRRVGQGGRVARHGGVDQPAEQGVRGQAGRLRVGRQQPEAAGHGRDEGGRGRGRAVVEREEREGIAGHE